MPDVNDSPAEETPNEPEGSTAAEPSSPLQAAPIEETAAAAPVESMDDSTLAEDDAGAEEEDAEVIEAHELKQIHPAPEHVQLEQLEDDDAYKLRDEGDVAALAMDIARLGQIFPIDVRQVADERYQVVTGFRRVAALKFLQRDRVLVRLHKELSDDDAALIALAEAIHQVPVSLEELKAMREKLEERGRLSAAARDMLEKALAEGEALAPEEAPGTPGAEEEVDADELAGDVATRLGQINQDLSLLADVFKDLDEGRRETLLEQLRYSKQLVDFLEGAGSGDES